jgi:hypothetical protein
VLLTHKGENLSVERIVVGKAIRKIYIWLISHWNLDHHQPATVNTLWTINATSTILLSLGRWCTHASSRHQDSYNNEPLDGRHHHRQEFLSIPLKRVPWSSAHHWPCLLRSIYTNLLAWLKGWYISLYLCLEIPAGFYHDTLEFWQKEVSQEPSNLSIGGKQYGMHYIL